MAVLSQGRNMKSILVNAFFFVLLMLEDIFGSGREIKSLECTTDIKQHWKFQIRDIAPKEISKLCFCSSPETRILKEKAEFVPDVRFLVDVFSFVLFFVFVTWQIFGSDQYFFLYLPTLIIIINYIRTTDEVHKNS